jgi:pimeloyl-ACP methyl ester carboxylesterase
MGAALEVRARIRDIDVNYESFGAGEPLLLIHGLGSSTNDWEPQIPDLARHFQVITYDVRGHGLTSKPRGPYSVQQFAEDALALLQHLHVGPAHVLGISMGGMIAFQLAVDHPAAVKSLTIVNSGPELVLRTWRQRLAIYSRFAIVRLMGMRKMGEVLANKLLLGPRHAATRETFVERWSRNDPSAYLRALRALIGWSVTARLGSIIAPTLILTADQDYTPVPFKEAYTRKIPGAKLVVVPDSRHMLPVECPAEFNRAALDFLRGLAGTGESLAVAAPAKQLRA